MAATVLSSARAVEMSVFVVRAFIRLRQFARGHAEITKRLDALEQKVAGHDEALKEMFAALRALLAHPEKPRRGIGFRSRGREWWLESQPVAAWRTGFTSPYSGTKKLSGIARALLSERCPR